MKCRLGLQHLEAIVIQGLGDHQVLQRDRDDRSQALITAARKAWESYSYG